MDDWALTPFLFFLVGKQDRDTQASRFDLAGPPLLYSESKLNPIGYQEGWKKMINHDVKVEQIKKTPTKNGEGGRALNHERSNEAERRRGEGKNAGRKTGRLMAVNQDGARSPQNPK
ncbi:hypothetical protein TNCV_5030661 [Trichonephila clavipes]|nr:hypothetical protein TNCV_5030661 [Trichonephila clavipes]